MKKLEIKEIEKINGGKCGTIGVLAAVCYGSATVFGGGVWFLGELTGLNNEVVKCWNS